MNAGAPLKSVSAKFFIRTLSAPIFAAAVLAGCSAGNSGPAASAGAQPAGTVRGPGTSTAQKPGTPHELTAVPPEPGVVLPPPTPLTPVPGTAASAGRGVWRAAPWLVHGRHVVYVTTLIPSGGREPAGIAWMDTGLLSARLYSGSISPGGGPYKYTAPIQSTQAATLVAAFNGGFKMANARAPRPARWRWPACNRSPQGRRFWPWPPARTLAKASTAQLWIPCSSLHRSRIRAA